MSLNFKTIATTLGVATLAASLSLVGALADEPAVGETAEEPRDVNEEEEMFIITGTHRGYGGRVNSENPVTIVSGDELRQTDTRSDTARQTNSCEELSNVSVRYSLTTAYDYDSRHTPCVSGTSSRIRSR